MGTPGLRLIQDLLAKSVAKWSGQADKSTQDKKNKSIKILENNIKVEYIETDKHDVKIEQDRIIDENPEIKIEGLKRKLVEAETGDKNGKKRKKSHSRSKFEVCGTEKDYLKTKTDETHPPDQKHDKSLIMRLLKNSAAKFTENREDKKIKIEKTESKKNKKCKKEISIKTEIIDSLELQGEGLVPTEVNNEFSCPLLKNHDAKGLAQTGIKIEARTNQNVKRTELEINKLDKHDKAHKALRKTNIIKRFFSPEEDDILIQEMNTLGENINLDSLAMQLGRPRSSIHSRIRRLKIDDRKFVRKSFSLTEDLVIMDAMLEKLAGKRLEDLHMLVDDTTPDFLTRLGRKMATGPRKRWGILKPWILQHYAGTLNLDIKRMLANFIADSFDSHDSIDWAVVVKRPEFAGHTLISLRRLFYGQLMSQTKKHQNFEHAEVTLRNIADYTEHSVTKVSERVLIRQKQVIDYFEQYVKKHGITNFL